MTATGQQVAVPVVDPVAIDDLRPGDRAVLRRYLPPGSEGPSSPARLFVAPLTIALLERHDRDGQPGWYLEGREDEMRGCWAVGALACGLVTTLERAPEG